MGVAEVKHPLPLSIAIICKDNARTIGRTLDSIRGLASEIIALDSGSTDSTIEMLRAAGADVRHQTWLGHVRQKQAALEACSQPWILSLDSDESLEPDLRRSIIDAVTADDPAVAGYEMNRKVWYAGRFLDHAWQPEWRLRLVRRGRARWGGYDPHDKLDLAPGASGRIARLTGTLRHDSIITMRAFLARQASHAELAARGYIGMGRRGSAMQIITSPAGALLKQLVLRGAWRDGWRGWAASGATAAAALMKHIILLEQSNNGEEKP